jgi:streptomycin 6-kinase
MSNMQTLEKNVINLWGKKGKEWLKNLPTIIDELSEHWQLSGIKPVQNMSWNYVGLALKNRDVPVALKLSCDKQLMQDEYKALKHFDGHGSIKVLDLNLEKNALLLERAIPGDLLKDDHPAKIADTMAIYASVVNQLASRPLPKEHSYKHASDWLKAIDRISDERVEKRYIQKAQEIRSFLLNSTEREYLCHGDLHLENIIKHEDTWLAIDPKGIIGEMAFEAAACDLISEEERKDTETIGKKISERVALLSNALDLDYDRLLYWIFLRVIISVKWFVEDNGDPSDMISFADCLYPLLVQPQSSQFILRRFNPGDARGLYNAISDKRVIKHMASEGLTMESCKQIIAKSTQHWVKYNIGDYAVVCKISGRIIGWAGFKLWQKDEFEILVVLSPQYWGFGHNIYLELLNKAKNEFKLEKIYILLPETRKSFRAITKLGFDFSENTVFNGEKFKKFVRKLK